MTGNNKVWRSPLAGLAAVAMLATMGVAASTANAAAPGAAVVTVQDGTNWSKYEVVKGDTLADAIHAAGATALPTPPMR